MSENSTATGEADNTPAEGPQIDAEPTEADTGVDTPGDGETADSGRPGDPNAEAKNWRIKYRSAATRADVAEARVAEQNRLHAERVLAKRLADPTDAWSAGLDVAAVLDDNGLIDEDAVLAYADELLTLKPHYAAKLKPVGAPASLVNGSDPIPTPGNGINWHGVIGGKTG